MTMTMAMPMMYLVVVVAVVAVAVAYRFGVYCFESLLGGSGLHTTKRCLSYIVVCKVIELGLDLWPDALHALQFFLCLVCDLFDWK
jgi:hypothetical protein